MDGRGISDLAQVNFGAENSDLVFYPNISPNYITRNGYVGQWASIENSINLHTRSKCSKCPPFACTHVVSNPCMFHEVSLQQHTDLYRCIILITNFG